jgi:hypothetical protein
VNLAPVFGATHSLRDQFPATQNFDPFAGLDLSLGGVLSGFTLERYVEGITTFGYRADLGWSWVTPTPQGNALTCAASGNGVNLLAGDAGTVMRSTDTVNWETRQIDSLGGITGLAFFGGHFVAVANNGVFLSNDGATWRQVSDGLRMGSCLAATAGRLAFVDGNYNLVTSSDGVDWTTLATVRDSLADETLYYPKGLAAGNGVLVAVGGNGASLSRVFSSSTGGASWTLRASGASYGEVAANAVAFGNGRFVCVGLLDQLLTSPNGVDWTPGRVLGGAADHGFNGLCFDGTRFVATGADGTIAASADGLTWTAQPSPTTQHLGRVVAAGGHLWAFGNGGLVLQATAPSAFASIGASATTGIPQQVAICRLRTLAGKLFAVAEDGQLFVSTDGTAFVAATSGSSLAVTDLTEHNGTFVAVGSGNAYTSTDGLTWTTRAPGVTSWWPNTVAYLNNQYVAAGYGGLILTSPDGIAWTKRAEAILGNTSETRVTALAYGDGAYLAVGWTWQPGTMSTLTIRSTDGVNWNWTSVSPGSGKLLDLEYRSGGFWTFTSLGQTWNIPPGQVFWSGVDGNGIETPGALHKFGGRGVLVQDAFSVFDYETMRRDRLSISGGDLVWMPCATPIESNSPAVFVGRRITEPVPLAWFGNRIYLGGNGSILRSRPIADLGAPQLFAQPISRSVEAGATVAFSAGVSGEGKLTYQWYKNGALLAGVTTPELLFTAAQPGDAGTYSVRVSNGAGGVTSADATLAVAASFAGWQIANFTTAELGNPAISGPLAVLGPDGASNLLKYAFGVAPRAAIPATAQTLTPPAVAGSPAEWTLVYRRPANRPDLDYAVESSTTLVSWSTTGIVHERIATADPDGQETWRGRVTTSAPRLFLHLRVTEK